MLVVFFFKQKTAYEMRISDWSSDVCSSDLQRRGIGCQPRWHVLVADDLDAMPVDDFAGARALDIAALLHRQIQDHRSEERRVGKACVSTCSSRWSPYHSTKTPQPTRPDTRTPHSLTSHSHTTTHTPQ